jgi:CRP/FNR family transcriptional regulator
MPSVESSNNSIAVDAPSEHDTHRANAPIVKLCPHSTGVSCGSCRLNELCLPIALNEGEMEQLDNIVERNRPLKKGDHLYRQHDGFKSIFAVRSGSFKSYVLSSSGAGRVTGFYLPGEIIGMDGIADRTHANSAIALEHASICEIPFNQLESLSLKLPVLQHNFFSIMGAEITKDQKVHTILSSYSAEQRIASFLLGISSRYARVGLSPTRFHLPMTRGDIGEYLGLTVETVSRLLTVLQKRDLIEVDNREIALVDKDRLKEIVGADDL